MIQIVKWDLCSAHSTLSALYCNTLKINIYQNISTRCANCQIKYLFIQIKEIASTPTKLLLAYKPDKEIEIILDSLYYKQILCTYSI